MNITKSLTNEFSVCIEFQKYSIIINDTKAATRVSLQKYNPKINNK
jgi:ribosomal protein L33